jgi:hypothetical protein
LCICEFSLCDTPNRTDANYHWIVRLILFLMPSCILLLAETPLIPLNCHLEFCSPAQITCLVEVDSCD